ncbi:MAG: hypothetical protein DWQ04_15645 [Chloroflexi bacterium]|nr:MAG: hypothetical protein DWQ04_15645 [Chloroflexota bacterium]
MNFLPELQPGWLNGWLLLVILYAIFGILLLVFPREVVSRLYDRTVWTRQDYLRRVINASLSAIWYGAVVLNWGTIWSVVFVRGMVNDV